MSMLWMTSRMYAYWCAFMCMHVCVCVCVCVCMCACECQCEFELLRRCASRSALFMLYISQKIRSCVKLYADNILIYRLIITCKDCEILQRDLDLIQSWANKWKMCFSPNKCQLIRVSNIKHPISFHSIPSIMKLFNVFLMSLIYRPASLLEPTHL